jgi:ABC-type uncharacterized transport system substrate-binding protein
MAPGARTPARHLGGDSGKAAGARSTEGAFERSRQSVSGVRRKALHSAPELPLVAPRHAPRSGLQLISVPMRASEEYEDAFAAMMQRKPNAFVTTNDGLILQHMGQIIDFVAKHHLPAMYQSKENVEAGGLMAYGATLSDLFTRGAWYVHRILQGAQPADLPLEQPTKFELSINLKTARALGLHVPPALLARADEVIE